MKKIIFAFAALIVLAAVIALTPQKTDTEFLRIHIRADSNAEQDQNVKYKVKEAVVEYLTPYLAEATSKDKAMQIVRSQLDGIKAVCDKTLAENGFDYVSRARLAQEDFPDRSYRGVTLPSGVYDALIVELGSGSGNNWWCVVYPPLCFAGGESNGTNSIVYKSKIMEIIRSWRQDNN